MQIVQIKNLETTLSSKKAADYLRVNESTVKRWADSGLLNCIKTPGGHRKFKIEDLKLLAKRYDYETSYLSLADDMTDLQQNILNRKYKPIIKNLQKNILKGNVNITYKLLYTLYINNSSLEEIFDGVVYECMRNIGLLWQNKVIGVENEHIASNTTLTALHQLNTVIQKNEQSKGLAICAGFQDEFHEIGLLCVKIFLEYHGWKVLYPGINLPYKSLIQLVDKNKPLLVCLSATYIKNVRQFEKQIKNLKKRVEKYGGVLYIGGGNVNIIKGLDINCNSIDELKKSLNKH